jgi:hypothetical protein
MLSPIEDTVEWVKSGVNFGYRSFVLAVDVALIYGAIYVSSKMIKGCTSCTDNQKIESVKTSSLENIANEKIYVIKDAISEYVYTQKCP